MPAAPEAAVRANLQDDLPFSIRQNLAAREAAAEPDTMDVGDYANMIHEEHSAFY